MDACSNTNIPSFYRYTSNILRCHSLFAAPQVRNTSLAKVYWGPTGTGKTHRSWAEAGDQAYIKSSSNKWWDGYRSEVNVIMDEFDGLIGITHLLRWLRYTFFMGGTDGESNAR